MRSMFVVCIIILFGSNVLAGDCCKEAYINSDRRADQQAAQTIIGNFLTLWVQNPDGIYRIPTDLPDQLPTISSGNIKIQPEKYTLINLWHHNDPATAATANNNTGGIAWWVFVPLSLYPKLEQLVNESIRRKVQEETSYFNKTGKTIIIDGKRAMLTSIISKIVTDHFSGWVLQDSFQQNIIVNSSSPVVNSSPIVYPVDFFSICNFDVNKMFYIGISDQKPDWIKDNLFDSSNDSSNDEDNLFDDSDGSPYDSESELMDNLDHSFEVLERYKENKNKDNEVL